MDNKTPGVTFCQQRASYLEARDIDKLLAQYHPDAVLLTFDEVAHGQAEIRVYLRNFLDQFGYLRLKAIDKYAETEDAILFTATFITGNGEASVYEVFVLREGKATHHFFSLLSFSPFG